MKIIDADDSVICNTCGYYHPENNTCNVKKCSGYGWGYVTKLDRKYCTSYRKQQENEQKKNKIIYFLNKTIHFKQKNRRKQMNNDEVTLWFCIATSILSIGLFILFFI